MICTVCNEKVISGDRRGLCYLHSKYVKRLTGPYFETLYDLVYWKATFLKKWDRLGYGKISVACAPHVEVAKMNQEHVAAIKERITEQLKLKKADLSMYANLARTLAYRFTASGNLSFQELYNDGMLCLKRLECRIEKGLDPKIISAWVKKSLTGYLRNQIMYRSSVVKNPQVNADRRTIEIDSVGFDDWHIRDDQAPNNEDQYIAKEREHQEGVALVTLAGKLNMLQRKILTNLLKDKPRTQEQLAKTNKVARTTITYNYKVIYTKARELYENI